MYLNMSRPFDSMTVELATHFGVSTRYTNASPCHVAAKIIALEGIPCSKSGQTAGLAVRAVVNAQSARDLSGLANPKALDPFINHPEVSD